MPNFDPQFGSEPPIDVFKRVYTILEQAVYSDDFDRLASFEKVLDEFGYAGIYSALMLWADVILTVCHHDNRNVELYFPKDEPDMHGFAQWLQQFMETRTADGDLNQTAHLIDIMMKNENHPLWVNHLLDIAVCVLRQSAVVSMRRTLREETIKRTQNLN
jgi:hypothetical protein